MNDLISRQAAIDALHMHLMYRMETDSNKKQLDDWINGLPSAQPEPKTARWVPLDKRFASWSSYYKCSECGFRINLRTVTDFSGQSVNYCPHCGLQMEEGET